MLIYTRFLKVDLNIISILLQPKNETKEHVEQFIFSDFRGGSVFSQPNIENRIGGSGGLILMGSTLAIHVDRISSEYMFFVIRVRCPEICPRVPGQIMHGFSASECHHHCSHHCAHHCPHHC